MRHAYIVFRNIVSWMKAFCIQGATTSRNSGTIRCGPRLWFPWMGGYPTMEGLQWKILKILLKWMIWGYCIPVLGNIHIHIHAHICNTYVFTLFKSKLLLISSPITSQWYPHHTPLRVRVHVSFPAILQYCCKANHHSTLYPIGSVIWDMYIHPIADLHNILVVDSYNEYLIFAF